MKKSGKNTGAMLAKGGRDSEMKTGWTSVFNENDHALNLSKPTLPFVENSSGKINKGKLFLSIIN